MQIRSQQILVVGDRILIKPDDAEERTDDQECSNRLPEAIASVGHDIDLWHQKRGNPEPYGVNNRGDNKSQHEPILASGSVN